MLLNGTSRLRELIKLRRAVYPIILAVVAALALSQPAWAFSFGKIRVTSAYNTLFKAEIPLESAAKPEGLVVAFGSPADYSKLGLKRPDFLDNLSLQVADHPAAKGQKIIYITSADPIYQPSFNLIIKAFINGGQILENYFIAIDFQKNLALEASSSKEQEQEDMQAVAREMGGQPRSGEVPARQDIADMKKEEEHLSKDEMAVRSALRGEQPKVAQPMAPSSDDKATLEAIRASEADAEQGPAPVMTAETPVITASSQEPEASAPPAPSKSAGEPVEIVIHGDETFVNSEPAPAPKQAMRAPVSAPGATPARIVGEGAYKVKHGDTLYAVTRKMTGGQDADRLIVALWRSNKKLFAHGNLHGIKKGAVLDWALAEEMADSISANEARKIVRQQWAAWEKLTVKVSAPPAIVAPPVKEQVAKKVEPRVTPVPVPAPAPVAQPAPAPAKVVTPQMSWFKALAEWKARNGVKGGDIEIVSVKVVDEKTGRVEAKVVRKTANGPKESTVTMEKGKTGYKVSGETAIPAPKSKPVAKDKAAVSKNKPFTLHVATFRDKGQAISLVKILRDKGVNAFEMTGPDGSGGTVSRVAVDRFKSAGEAVALAGKLSGQGIARSGRALKLPYSVLVNAPAPVAEARAKAAQLAASGVSAYVVADGDKAAVYSGAYLTEQEAAAAAQEGLPQGSAPAQP
ncbi:MAG: SPOR domain-containing protein [Nitrospinae bacterium]|nr:SPOR domain-containing protein [Nitrospinota bacterium]